MSALTGDPGGVASGALVTARMDGAQVGERQNAGIGVQFSDGDGRKLQQQAVGRLMMSCVPSGQTQRPAVFGPAEFQRFVALADAAQQSSPDPLFQYLLVRLGE